MAATVMTTPAPLTSNALRYRTVSAPNSAVWGPMAVMTFWPQVPDFLDCGMDYVGVRFGDASELGQGSGTP